MTSFEPNVDVTVYTKSNCPQCVATKKLLKQLAVPYNEIDIEADPSVLEFLKAEGHRAAPVVMTDTDSWSGFNDAKLRKLAPAATTDDEDWDF